MLAGVAVSTVVYHAVTDKEAVLYLGYANVAPGEDLDRALTSDYLSAAGLDARRQEVYVSPALYLSDDPAPENHQYAYASRLKIMASVNSRQLDAVLMNRESYDLLSGEGYLLPLEPLLDADPPLRDLALPYLAENAVVLRDNAIEYRLGEAESLETVTETAANAIELSRMPLFAEAGVSGVLVSSPTAPGFRRCWTI